MRPVRRLVLLAVIAAATTAGLAVPGASATAPGYKRCGTVDIGYTNAQVAARRVRCRNARRLVRKWRQKVNSPSCQPAVTRCRVVRVSRYRCVWGGDEVTVRLRCTKGRKRVRAYWGD